MRSRRSLRTSRRRGPSWAPSTTRSCRRRRAAGPRQAARAAGAPEAADLCEADDHSELLAGVGPAGHLQRLDLVADVAQPGLVKQLVQQGHLKPLTYAKPTITQNFSPAWAQLGTFNDKI